MLTRALLILLLLALLARAVWRLLSGIVAGASGPAPGRTSTPAERMVRDPVCGTYVVPSRALSVQAAGVTHFFCSEQCRNAYGRRANAS